MFRFFVHKSCGILTSRSEIKLAPPVLEAEVLNTGPPGEHPVPTF